MTKYYKHRRPGVKTNCQNCPHDSIEFLEKYFKLIKSCVLMKKNTTNQLLTERRGDNIEEPLLNFTERKPNLGLKCKLVFLKDPN